jgi:hypothetical protein
MNPGDPGSRPGTDTSGAGRITRRGESAAWGRTDGSECLNRSDSRFRIPDSESTDRRITAVCIDPEFGIRYPESMVSLSTWPGLWCIRVELWRPRGRVAGVQPADRPAPPPGGPGPAPGPFPLGAAAAAPPPTPATRGGIPTGSCAAGRSWGGWGPAGRQAGAAPRRSGPRAWGLRPSAYDPSHPAIPRSKGQKNPGRLLRPIHRIPDPRPRHDAIS